MIFTFRYILKYWLYVFGSSYSFEQNDLLTFQIAVDNIICNDFRNDLHSQGDVSGHCKQVWVPGVTPFKTPALGKHQGQLLVTVCVVSQGSHGVWLQQTIVMCVLVI